MLHLKTKVELDTGSVSMDQYIDETLLAYTNELKQVHIVPEELIMGSSDELYRITVSNRVRVWATPDQVFIDIQGNEILTKDIKENMPLLTTKGPTFVRSINHYHSDGYRGSTNNNAWANINKKVDIAATVMGFKMSGYYVTNSLITRNS